MHPMPKALILDLDNCIAPAREVGEDLYEPAFAAIRQANAGHISDATLEEAFADIWRHPLDWVAARHGFSEAMRNAAWQVFMTMEVARPMHGYGDLGALAELPAQRFLVTSGFRRLQESKIKALQLAPIFTACFVDAIDEPNRLGKQGLFEQILKDYGLAATEVLVIGDNADSEIAVGNRLRIRTVQTLRPDVPRANNAKFHIHSFADLKALLARTS